MEISETWRGHRPGVRRVPRRPADCRGPRHARVVTVDRGGFIDGARAQGADVVDYGLIGTDLLYYAWRETATTRRADHRVAQSEQYNGMKLGRAQSDPAERRQGISDIATS